MKYTKITAIATFSVALGLASKIDGATIYTNKATFISTVNPGFYLENFNSAPPASFNYNNSGFSYTVTGGGNGVYYGPAGFIANKSNNQSLTITFTSGNVTAV